MNAVERDFRREIQRAGLELLDLTIGGNNHYKARVRAATGHESLVTWGCSPSDTNGVHRLRQNLRRVARGVPLGGGQAV